MKHKCFLCNLRCRVEPRADKQEVQIRCITHECPNFEKIIVTIPWDDYYKHQNLRPGEFKK